ncbi:MFS transporter [Sphaerisporangium corydalis]|uniref:MFS transporter n=1 Tax=Sphaerisporangium corydalis TaxID=1441875 RepID=A0ABV9EAE0_9ACTN|nr:MFS transporter [Sphaerisporangium corydalis]
MNSQPEVTTATTPAGWIRRSILAHQQFRALYIANIVSKFGTHVGYVALPVLAQVVLHAGPVEVGVLAALSTVSFLLIGLPAGVWVDRTRKRGVLIAADLTRAALIASIPAAWALGALTLVQLYAVALLAGMATVFFDIAHLSYLPHIVGRDRLTSANATLSGLDEAAKASGRGLGGFVVQLLGPPLAVLVDAGSFLWSALFVRRIRVRDPAPEATRGPLWRDVGMGLRYVLTSPVLRPLAIKGAVANFAEQICLVSFLVLFVAELRLPTGTLGVLLSAGGVGAFCGALAAPTIGRRLGLGRGIWLVGMCTAPFALLTGLMEPGPLLWVGAAGWVIATVTFGVENVLAVSLRQSITSDGMLGRMNAGFRFLFMGSMSAGSITGGLIGAYAGVRTAIWIGSSVLALGWLIAFFSPLRRLRHIDELTGSSGGRVVPTL